MSDVHDPREEHMHVIHTNYSQITHAAGLLI